jgi:hypothetical protein
VKRPVLFLLAALAVLSAPRLSAAAPVFSATLDTIWVTGDTRYLMELPASPYGVSSELVFPLNTLLEGVRLSYSPKNTGRHPWTVEASFYSNLVNPYGIMQDYDWYMWPGYPKVPFSYTESQADMRWYLAGAELQVALTSGSWGNLILDLGYRFQFIKQVIIGYTGWQYDDTDDDGLPDVFDFISGSEHALDYQIFYNAVTAGLSLTLCPAPPVTVTADAGPALVYVSDRDDHLLRYKLSTASGVGFGGYAGLEARYTWSTANPRLRPFVALSGSGLWFFAKTLQTQSYYTGATEEPPGTTWVGIDHRISTRQYRAAFILGLQF